MIILQPGEIIANRRLVRLLSEGGMGEVWLAIKLELDKPVVLKFILPHFAAQAQFRQLFEQEARLVARLDHPNIVRVFDFGRIAHPRGDILWFEQEYIRGEDLARLCHRYPQGFPLHLAIFIVSEALKALLFAHENCASDGTPQPIVHRDIKPHNVLVAYEGSVHLADFGIATIRKPDSLPTLSGLKGTVGYIAPEHVMGQKPDHRSDLFAMGLVFWEVLGGQRLFTADTDQGVLWKTAECVIPPLAEHGVQVPPPVEDIVRRLLARDPGDRYQSARQALEDLRRAPGGRDATSLDLKAFLAPLAASALPTPSSPQPAFTSSARGEISEPPVRKARGRAVAIAVSVVVALLGLLSVLLFHGEAASPRPAPTAAPAPSPPVPDARPAVVEAPAIEPDAPSVGPAAMPDAATEPRPKTSRPRPKPSDDSTSEKLRIKLPGD